MADTVDIQWEEDPLCFIFNDEIPGKVKMHTRRLDMKDWVKIDNTYIPQMNLKRELIKTEKEHLFVSNRDQSTIECKWELFELLVEYLPNRFPDIFERRDNSIYNKALQTSVSTQRVTDQLEGDDFEEDPLVRASKLTQEDWVLVEWDDKEDAYVVTAGIVYFPMRWSLQQKFNNTIAGIHVPVGPFKDHLLSKVSDLFKKMKPEAPIWRANWAIFNDLKDPLDLYAPLGSLDRNDVNKTSEYDEEKTGKELLFRAEYQTLRKLPKTKCIAFSIRTYQRYLEDFNMFPTTDVLGLMNAIKTLNEGFALYKGSEFWEDAALKYLQNIITNRENKCSSKQISYVAPAVFLGATILLGFAHIKWKI